MKFSGFDDGGW